MALAYISYAGISNGNAEFYADIGTSRYYRYRIGNQKTRVNGMDMADDVTHNADITAHTNANPFNSRFMIKIPVMLFTGKRQYVQLFSYADAAGSSPALSAVVTVYPQADILDNGWPLLTTQSKHPDMQTNYHYPAFNTCRSVGFSFEESRFSNAMFWDSLLQVAKVLAPVAVDAIKGLLKSSNNGAVSATGNTTNGAAATSGANAGNEDIIRIITAIAEAVGKQQAPAQPPAGNTPAPVTTVQPNTAAQPELPKSASRVLSYANGMSYTRLRNRKRFTDHKKGFARQQVLDGGVLTGPLLASLLGPLLQNAPQLLQAIGDTPLKLMNAKRESDLKKQKQEQDYLTNLLQLHNQNALLQLLATSDKLNGQNPPVSMSFSTTNKINIAFETGKAITVSGKQKFVYTTTKPVKLLLHLKANGTPPDRPIPKAIVQLEIKEAASLKLLLEKKYRQKDVYLNSMLELELLPSELKALPLTTDLLVTASFVWPGRSGQSNKGQSEVHTIYLVQDYFLKQAGDRTGNEIALKDINKYRVFWNKIWEGTARNKQKWETRLEVKYYVYFRHTTDSNARIETKLKVNPQEDEETSRRLKTEGKLKSGLEVSPVELNKLLPAISNYPLLTQPQLQALQSDDLQKRYNQEARAHLELKGKKEETGAIWAYPEVALHQFILNKVQTADEKGQVTEVAEEIVHFPCVTSIHFAGVKTV